MPRDDDRTDRAHVIAALAGVAMHALMAGPMLAKLVEIRGTTPGDGTVPEAIAKSAMDHAEALLAEIERRHGGPL